ncbi:phosphotransferase [Streptomyces vietnamensis]|uniref:phosphotransferase n=1 Tax=Streptomyces vietnamensis TaxID=362257 RepID=UPI003428A754
MTPSLRERERIELVTLLLASEFGIISTAVEAGPTGTVTHNYLASGQDDRQWFVKTYPQGTDVRAAEAAVKLGEYARLCRVPVPAALPMVDADRFVTSGRGLLLSVTRFVPDAVTADGRITGVLWEAVGQAVGRLHRGFARNPHHPPPALGARDKAIDIGRNVTRLEELVARCDAAPPATEFGRWAHAAARSKLRQAPHVARMLQAVPEAMVTQLVHGDLAGPNVLLRGSAVAALVDFQPPSRRGAVWEIGRIALDPRTVLAQPDWPEGLARLLATYHELHPRVPVAELVSVVRVTAAALALSVYPLSLATDRPLPASLQAYACARYRAAAVLRERLHEAEEVLRACLA